MAAVPEMIGHVPVLVNEVCEIFNPCLGTGVIVDATVGGGGHTSALVRAFLEKEESKGNPGVQILGIDLDPESLAIAFSRLEGFGCQMIDIDAGSKRGSATPLVCLVKANYADMATVVNRLGFKPIKGVLMDLGISSIQLQPERGFSFDADGPLDMRFDRTGGGKSCLDIIRRASVRDLERWLKDYGDEPAARRIGRRIYSWRRRINTTRELADLVASLVPARRRHRTLARVFQALRIVVNREIESLRCGLEAAVRILAPGGRLVVICYQSGEDRCVKEILRRHKGCLRNLTPKPLRPSLGEVGLNPRARSARLRALEKVL
ncbi:MAG: 16S rRNA (cytosine(1402)-N(4))-methyltransferase RsmH [candidate division WOR-3 bacterium]